MVVDFNPCSAGTRSCVRPSHHELHLLPDWMALRVMLVEQTQVSRTAFGLRLAGERKVIEEG